MSLKLHLLLGLFLLGTTFGSDDERARYDNYRVYKVIPSTEAQLHVLQKIEGTTDSLIFLGGCHAIGQNIEVVVAPHKLPDFLQLITTNRIENKLIERNLQRHFKSKQVASYRSRSEYDWTDYHELDDTYDWLKSLVKKFPKIVTLIEGGKTYENRSILGVKISHKAGNKGIFIEAGIHAREWIAPATATYIINQLLSSNVTSIKNIAENYDWYIFPHTNPDGYVYTHTTKRIWRGTRSLNGDMRFGVDPNRNWDIHWNEDGGSSYPKSESYPGPRAFSEIETRSLSKYITSLKRKIQLYISLHAYSQLLLYPLGYTKALPANINDFKQVSNAAITAISKRYGTEYKAGTITGIMYPAFGSSIDWAYEKAGIKMSFVYELRPNQYDGNGYKGFELPTSQIIPTGEETLDSITAMVGEVKRLGYFH